MTKMREARLTERDCEVIFEIWEIMREHKDEVGPIQMMALLAQIMGSIAEGVDTGLNDDQLSQLLMGNLTAGRKAMKAVLENERAGHA